MLEYTQYRKFFKGDEEEAEIGLVKSNSMVLENQGYKYR